MTTDHDQLAAYVRYRIGQHVHYCHGWRIDALTAMIVRHWPHAHLEAIRPHGIHHKAIGHAMALVRAQVREQWEARYGIGPLWSLALAPAVSAISFVLLELWFADAGWRGALLTMSRRMPLQERRP